MVSATLLLEMNVSQVDFEEVLSRAGMQVRGGTLTQAPWSTDVGNVAWAGRDMGIFVVDWANSKTVELEALARKDVIVCTAVLNQDGAWTDFAVGNSRFDAKGAEMTMVFVPQHERFQFSTSVSRGLKAVTVVVNLISMMKARGLLRHCRTRFCARSEGGRASASAENRKGTTKSINYIKAAWPLDASTPPSTGRFTPFTKLASSLARNAMTLAISRGWAPRPNGMRSSSR
jgi:hypothetical protein